MINIVRNEKSWIESNAVEQLKKYEKLDGMIRITGLPDLHAGRVPVGAAFVTEKKIYPYLTGSDIGCGIALFDTNVRMKKFKRENFIRDLNKVKYLEDIHADLSEYKFPYMEKLGTIGSGNHFAEFQKIEKVYLKDEFDKLNISKDNLMLLVHSGSRVYGQIVLEKYLESFGTLPLEEGSAEFNEYMKEHDNAAEYAKVNRKIIAEKLLKITGKEKPDLVLDSSHNMIAGKAENGRNIYIHRKGAAPSDMGMIVIAGTRDSLSYIVKPKENLSEYSYSVSHGAGRKWTREGSKDRMLKIHGKNKIIQMNKNLIYSDRKVLFEESREAYKNIERVIQDLVEHDMIEIVASLKPLITFKR
ncbi:RNA ligase RtcB family protein [Sebaldella sp. S0638]|nr:RNA ligase RtcB family protein [Sebaldella sp. S0638]